MGTKPRILSSRKTKKSNCDKYKENLKSILKHTTQIVTKLKKSTSKKNSRSQIMIKFKNSTQIVQTQELKLCRNSNRDKTQNLNSNKTQNWNNNRTQYLNCD